MNGGLDPSSETRLLDPAATLELPAVSRPADMAEALAKAFYEARTLLAPDTAARWQEMREPDRQLAVAAMRLLLANGLIAPGPCKQSGGD